MLVGTLPFIFRPGSSSTPDESTMSIIRRLIYRASHCYCCPPQWLGFQNFVKTIVTDPFFDVLITFCILMNTASMSLEEYPVVPERTKMLEKANNVFTIIFIVEMALKIIGTDLIINFDLTIL